jgi:hypothetical protein
MAELPLEFRLAFRAFQFEAGIGRIRASFRASIEAMEQAADQARAEEYRYLSGGENDDEYDEDGALIRSTRTGLQHEALQAAIALNVVREAFITSAFHYWERSARAWTGSDERTFARLRDRVIAEGIEVSDELELLNALNNLLKHDNPARGREVFDKRKDLFRFSRAPSGSWQSALVIANADVEHFIEVVSASGPRTG